MIVGPTSGVIDLGADNDLRLQRLRTALSLGSGFQLIIVEAELGPIRKEVVRRIQTWSHIERIGGLTMVELAPDRALSEQLAVASGAIVTGFEQPNRAGGPARDWIVDFNWSRDALPGLVPGPLVLVVSQATHEALFERASDLYSWRRHTTRVTLTVRELAFPLASPGDHYWLDQRERLTDVLTKVVLTPHGRATLAIDVARALLQLGDEPGASRALSVAEWASSQADDEDAADLRAYCKLGRADCALVRRDFADARRLLDGIGESKHAAVMRASLALRRGKLQAAEGAWAEAVRELTSSVAFMSAAYGQHLLACVHECLAQIAFARGDILEARRAISDLVSVVAPYLDTWGVGLLLRLADVVIDLYPDEVSLLLDVDVDAEAGFARGTLVAIQHFRTKRAWLLGCAALAHEELARMERWVRPDDPDDMLASVAYCRALVALTAGGAPDDEVAHDLVRARERFGPVDPGRAAIAGNALGEFWSVRRRFDLAVPAYRLAAEDARRAGDPTGATDAELAELRAAIDGGMEPEDAVERLSKLASQLRTAGRIQGEGVARTSLARCMLRRGLCDRAAVELDRARACFAATADTLGELAVTEKLSALRRAGSGEPL